MPKTSLMIIVGVIGLGCGSDTDRPAAPRTSPPAEATTASGDANAIAIADFKFVPEDVTVDVGTAVTWTNEDAAPHTATADDGSFDTGDLREGDEDTVTFSEAGSFTYFCEFHKFRRAKITVR